MKPVFTRVEENPEIGAVGDCYRACLATLLDLPWRDVPHFAQLHQSDWSDGMVAVDDWLASRGLAMFRFAMSAPAIGTVLTALAQSNPGKAMILIGQGGRRPADHAVVCCDGFVLHDPTPGCGIVGPVIGAGFYQVEVLGLVQLVLRKRDEPLMRAPEGMRSGGYMLGPNGELIELQTTGA